MSREELVQAAAKKFAEGFLLILEAAGAEPKSVHAAVKEQKEVNDTREGKSNVVAIASAKKTKPAPVDDDDEDEAPTPPKGKASPASAKALKQLAALDLDEASRPELKAVAVELGIDAEGKKASELRTLLNDIKSGKSKPSSKSAVVEDDEEEAPPAKPATAKSKKIDYPDTKTMKKEIKVFCRVQREAIAEAIPEFFDPDAEGGDADKPLLHEILSDEDLLKKAWADNVLEAKNADQWDDMLEQNEKLKAAAAAE